jgi:Macrocin-O-methyltransferase (TylF)
MKHSPRSMVRSALQQRGYRLVRDAWQRQLIAELVEWHGEALPPRLPRRDRRVELLAEAQEASQDPAADGGAAPTSVSAALYLIRTLHQALATVGDVCQFGVGQGHAAALLAHELDGSGRTLWLFDTFNGSGTGSGADGAGGEVLDLSALERPGRPHELQAVLERLQAIEFPPGATRIVPGPVTVDTTAGRLPRQVAFAHLDLAAHQPTLAALTLVHPQLRQGGRVVVNDYRAPASPTRDAVDAFLAGRRDDYELTFPLRFAGHFAILRKLV